MNIDLEEHLASLSSPANLQINERIKAFREYCRKHGCLRPYHHFAFGQSPFPPPPPIVEALRIHAKEHDYMPTAGLLELREAIADYHARHFGTECRGSQVVIAPGSKAVIAALLATIQGSVIIPAPSWVSYLPQAKILRKEAIPVRLRWEDDLKLTPESLEGALARARTDQKILILNNPHNPTGAVYSRYELEELAQICRLSRTVVISDEIYGLTTFDPEAFTSMMRVYPEGTIVTNGLSKDRSSGGYRFGVGIFPEESKELLGDVLKIVGSTFSCVAAPIQYAALEAYSPNAEIEAYMRDCRELNAFVGRRTAALMDSIPGVKTSFPEGAYYLYVDFNEWREQFKSLDLATCADFAEHLLKIEHVALLPGNALILPDDDYSVRCSYVDYDGEKALEQWRKQRPGTPDEEEAFFGEHCDLIIDGVRYLERYLDQVGRGERPKHVMQ